jgi:hypothetical protein
LTVPIQAVTSVKGRQVCFVETVNGREKRPVEVGMYNDRMIEIKSGLKEGERVLLSAQADGDDVDLSGAIADPDEADEAVKAANKRVDLLAKNAKKMKTDKNAGKDDKHINPYLNDPNSKSRGDKPDKGNRPPKPRGPS